MILGPSLDPLASFLLCPNEGTSKADSFLSGTLCLKDGPVYTVRVPRELLPSPQQVSFAALRTQRPIPCRRVAAPL